MTLHTGQVTAGTELEFLRIRQLFPISGASAGVVVVDPGRPSAHAGWWRWNGSGGNGVTIWFGGGYVCGLTVGSCGGNN